MSMLAKWRVLAKVPDSPEAGGLRPSRLAAVCWLSLWRHVSEAQPRKLPNHVLMMGCGPVDSPAAWTLYKACLGGKNVRRDMVSDLFFGYGNDWLVTPGTARESMGEWIDLKGRDHLLELAAEMIVLDEEKRDVWRATQPVEVARQDRSPLGARMAHQRRAGEVCSVGSILSDDTQPRGQAAEHLIDGETMDHQSGAMRARVE
jgi:hypothetical protein